MEQSIYDRLYTPNSNESKGKKSIIEKLKTTKDRLLLYYQARKSNVTSIEPISITSYIRHIKFNKTHIVIPLTILVVGAFGVVFMSEIAQDILASRRFDFADINGIDADVIEPTTDNQAIEVINFVDDIQLEPAKLDKMYADKLERIRVEEERRRKEAEITRKANALDSFLVRQGSPMAGHGRLIVETAEKCGFDYTDILGISMNESGLGRAMIPSQKGTAFGFMDGIRGETWEQAIPRVMCSIGNSYTKKYGMTLSLARAYGPKSWTDAEAQVWLSHVIGYKNMIPR